MIRVLHSLPIWLQQTQTWIYAQLTAVPAARVVNHVACELVANLDQFPIANLHCLRDESAVFRYWARAMRRLGLRRNFGLEARIARRIGARVLHSHFGDIGWRNAGIRRRSGARHVVTFYGYDVDFLPRQPGWGPRLREVFDDAELILCEGPHMRDSLLALGCEARKVRLHHLGIALDRLPFRPKEFRPGDRLRILMAGRFVEKKGIPFAIEALGKLRGRLDFELTVVGDAMDAPSSVEEKRRILDAIERTGIGERVKLTGFCRHADLIAEAYRHHLFLSPSVTASDGDTEGGAPVTLIEAAAAGMFIVASRHCDIPNVVLDGRTGLLAQERDVDGLANCLLEAASCAARWPGMLALGRQRVETEFNAAVQGLRLAAIYESVAQ